MVDKNSKTSKNGEEQVESTISETSRLLDSKDSKNEEEIQKETFYIFIKNKGLASPLCVKLTKRKVVQLEKEASKNKSLTKSEEEDDDEI